MAAELSDKAGVREYYDALIKESYETLEELLIPIVGGKVEWGKIAKRVTEDKTQNIIKFIYTVDSTGEVIVDEEKIRGKVTGRAAHSELASGLNLYGAGELVFSSTVSGWEMSEINNGSGHYRPSALTLPYVVRILQSKGFDTSRALVVDSLQRGTQLADASIITA